MEFPRYGAGSTTNSRPNSEPCTALPKCILRRTALRFLGEGNRAKLLSPVNPTNVHILQAELCRGREAEGFHGPPGFRGLDGLDVLDPFRI